jgi:TolB-like protein/Flp pilus assembly protein TadD
MVIALLLAATFQCPDGTPPPCRGVAVRGPATNSVAVLYFESSSRDSGDAQLAAGMTEEIIAALGQVERLDVRSRYISRRLTSGAGDPLTAARAAGLSWLVTGTMQPVGQRLNLRAELIQPATGRVKWSHRYDWPRADVEGLLAQLARVIATEIAGELLPAEQRRLARTSHARDPLVGELILRARHLFNQYNADALRSSVVLAEEAIRRDSTYAPSWSQLAMDLVLQRDFGAGSEVLMRARSAAEHALALDSLDAWAWMSLSGIAAYSQDVSSHAESMMRRAAALAPRDAGIQAGLGAILAYRMKGDEGVAAARRATELDPEAPGLRMSLAFRLADAHHFDEAIQAWQNFNTVDSTAAEPYRYALRSWRRQQGRCAEAAALARAAADTIQLIQSLPCAGRMDEARALAGERRRQGRGIGIVAWFALQEPDSAIASLTRVLDARTPFDPEFLTDTAIDPYRRDPRLVAALARMGLP